MEIVRFPTSIPVQIETASVVKPLGDNPDGDGDFPAPLDQRVSDLLVKNLTPAWRPPDASRRKSGYAEASSVRVSADNDSRVLEPYRPLRIVTAEQAAVPVPVAGGDEALRPKRPNCTRSSGRSWRRADRRNCNTRPCPGNVGCSGGVPPRCREAACRTRRPFPAWLASFRDMGCSRITSVVGGQLPTWTGASAGPDYADGTDLDHACSALMRPCPAGRSRRACASS